MSSLDVAQSEARTALTHPLAARAAAAAPAALTLCGCAAMAFALTADFLGLSRPGLGLKQLAALIVGALFCLTGTMLSGRSRTELARFAATTAQIAVLCAAFRAYDIENIGFSQFIAPLIFCGFIANQALPAAARPAFFLLLSLAGLFGVLHLANGLIILGCGLVLIAICHLKAPMAARIALLLAAAAGLAALRLDWIKADWTAAVLPILASMFMFRLSIYLYDIAHGKGPKGWAQRLGYFFMLPNAVFPFFPVVDFTAFGRTYYNEDPLRIYERGAAWMLRGLIHLLLYRAVSYYLVIDPLEVDGPGELLYYATTNFFLYLKISGLFHLIVGVLLVFGFNLPETHTRYYFSNSFIDFWRRINIYWKDYMQKMVFTPSFIALTRRGLGQNAAILVSMLLVFAATWALHAYQWFWIRGEVHLSGPDAFFWGFLAAMLVAQTAYEMRIAAMPRAATRRPLLSARAALALRTIAMMFVVFVLWSLWTSASFGEWLALLEAGGFPHLADGATPAEAARAVLYLGAAAVALALAVGVTFGLGPRAVESARLRKPARKDDRILVSAAARLAAAGAILALQSPAATAPFSAGVQQFALDLGTSKLNARDAAALERGYYEGLTDVNRFNTELWQLYSKRPTGWVDIRDTEAARDTNDYLQYELRPSTSIIYKGAPFQTNRWGMRDRHYAKEKPPGAFRIALLGDSRAMGYGVADPDTFDTILEDRLNAEFPGRSYEILNFGVADYKPVQRLMILERKALDFQPDAILFTGHFDDFELRHLAEAVKNGAPIPYSELQSIVARSGATQEMKRAEIRRRIDVFEDEVVRFVYGKTVETASARGILPVWIYVPSVMEYSREQELRCRKLKAMAEEAGFVTLDLSGMFAGTDMKKLWVAEWDHHPNAEGNRMIAEAMLAAFRSEPRLAAAMRITPPSRGQATSQ
jgi:D-alanyl-lipoteichoic acid acyltransferase DltB (MBOAT superfamily)